jgi:hypothetical protein
MTRRVEHRRHVAMAIIGGHDHQPRSVPSDPGASVTLELATGLVLILVPVAFNLAFFELGRSFDYPDILRRDPDEILRRFASGGPGLLLRWQALMLSALGMLPVAAMLAVVVGASPELTVLAVTVGVAASLVQAAGLARWPFAVPELARRYLAAPDGPTGDATRDTVRVVFATLHRYLGVGIGEHLGYLLTGAWTLLAAWSIMSTSVLPTWFGVVGLPIGVALLAGSLEFVGPNERDGWRMMGVVVPIAYIAWSVWLIAAGVLLIL